MPLLRLDEMLVELIALTAVKEAYDLAKWIRQVGGVHLHYSFPQNRWYMVEIKTGVCFTVQCLRLRMKNVESVQGTRS